MSRPGLAAVARAMVARGRGILAADEFPETIERRFAAVGVTSTPDTRRDFRELIFRSRAAIAAYISAVILYDETIRQSARDGTPLVRLIEDAGAIPGVKADLGMRPLAAGSDEVVTVGLDDLAERLREYAALGARFAKWRAVVAVGRGRPSGEAMAANADALARYAATSQQVGLVPIVEPEVLMDGGHDLATCGAITERYLGRVFTDLRSAHVALDAIVLKPSMVVPGSSAPAASAADVADATLAVLHSTVPEDVPGIAFLSGGQSDADATARLDAMNRRGTHPWRLTFSFSRALLLAPLAAWRGRPENVIAAQEAFARRAEENARASLGTLAAS